MRQLRDAELDTIAGIFVSGACKLLSMPLVSCMARLESAVDILDCAERSSHGPQRPLRMPWPTCQYLLLTLMIFFIIVLIRVCIFHWHWYMSISLSMMVSVSFAYTDTCPDHCPAPLRMSLEVQGLPGALICSILAWKSLPMQLFDFWKCSATVLLILLTHVWPGLTYMCSIIMCFPRHNKWRG